MPIKQFVLRAVPAFVGAALLSAAPVAFGQTLPNQYYTTYGDAQVYSLGTLAYIHCRETTGGSCANATGTPYNIASSPGQIQDMVVIATGTENNPVNTNFSGMDNAYRTPDGKSGSNYFSTTSVADPGQVGGAFYDRAGSWDSSVAALTTYLGAGKEPVFFFNNNQLNAEVNLAAWGRVWVSYENSETPVGGLNFYLTNQRVAGTPNTYLDPILQHSGGGIDFNEAASPWTSFTGSGTAPVVGDMTRTDYIISGSNYCVHNTTYLPVACNDPNSSGQIKNNLGANEVAYAVLFPELNSWLTNTFAGLSSTEQAKYTMHVDFRLGCQNSNGTDTAALAGSAHCSFNGTDLRSLNNGYEQLFIAAFDAPTRVPEPGTLALLGLALGGLGLMRRRVRAA